MFLILASKNLDFLINVRIGVTICLVSIVPDATCGNIGVNNIKLSSETKVISISALFLKYDSNFKQHSIPANPPPKTKILFITVITFLII